MTIDRIVFAVAGTFVLLGVVLAQLHQPYWLFFTAFVGLNMLQAAFTGFCPLVTILKRIGAQPGAAFR